MAKLYSESINILKPRVSNELNEANGKREKTYYLEGIFSTIGVENRNGRTYPRWIWEQEVERYNTETLEKNTINTLMEFQHPPRSEVSIAKAVGKMLELYIEGDYVMGKCKILNDNSEITNKLKALIDEGIAIGVSSRGVGEVDHNGQVTEYSLITYDIVDEPSDYNANLEGFNESFNKGELAGKNFLLTESKEIVEVTDNMQEDYYYSSLTEQDALDTRDIMKGKSLNETSHGKLADDCISNLTDILYSNVVKAFSEYKPYLDKRDFEEVAEYLVIALDEVCDDYADLYEVLKNGKTLLEEIIKTIEVYDYKAVRASNTVKYGVYFTVAIEVPGILSKTLNKMLLNVLKKEQMHCEVGIGNKGLEFFCELNVD